MQVVGNIRHAPLRMHLAVRRTVEPVLDEEMPGHLRVHGRNRTAQRQAHPDVHIFQAVAVVAQFGQQARRFGGRHGHANGLVRLHQGHGLGDGAQFLAVSS